MATQKVGFIGVPLGAVVVAIQGQGEGRQTRGCAGRKHNGVVGAVPEGDWQSQSLRAIHLCLTLRKASGQKKGDGQGPEGKAGAHFGSVVDHAKRTRVKWGR